MTYGFTPDAAGALGGPAWLVERRQRAAEQLATIAWPTDAEEIWRYSRINQLDLERFRPLTAAELGEPGVENAPGGGPLASELGERAALVVVRDGRVVHHELSPELVAQGVTVCGLATCDASAVEPWLGQVADASPDAFSLLHDAFLAGGAIDIQIDKLKSIKLPKLQEQLASLPSIRQVNFVLDVTCACAAHVLDNLRLPFDIMPESTYAGKVP